MNVFETEALRYDEWFEKHPLAYQAELAAVRALLPETGRGLEIGVGTGRFALPLGISGGVEPAAAMRRIAKGRGLEVLDAVAEALPYPDGSFDFALMVTTLCFVDNPLGALREAWRVLKPGGRLVVGLVDADSELGRRYEARRDKNPFYRDARFFSASETIQLLDDAGFGNFRCRQTLFQGLEERGKPQPIEEGFGLGGFVALSGTRP